MRGNDLSGRRFGRLLVLRPVGSDKHGRRKFDARCDCGKERVVAGPSLTIGKTTSCGCAQRDSARVSGALNGRAGSTTHDMSRTPEYRAWRAMRARCEVSSHISFPNYGGRGIRLCPRWRASFHAFIGDVGCRPSSVHSIDRIDNDGNYELGNVRWATKVDQSRNRRTTRWATILGETMCVADWARRWGVCRRTASRWIEQGRHP